METAKILKDENVIRNTYGIGGVNELDKFKDLKQWGSWQSSPWEVGKFYDFSLLYPLKLGRARV